MTAGLVFTRYTNTSSYTDSWHWAFTEFTTSLSRHIKTFLSVKITNQNQMFIIGSGKGSKPALLSFSYLSSRAPSMPLSFPVQDKYLLFIYLKIKNVNLLRLWGPTRATACRSKYCLQMKVILSMQIVSAFSSKTTQNMSFFNF